jgi:hypothetical protein
VSVDGGDGDDELQGPDVFNLWLLDGVNSGSLNTSNEFVAFENLRGGNEKDIFSVTSDGSLTGRLDGHLGSDDLRGPSQSVAWNVTGPDAGELTDQLTGATLLKFDGIQNLDGADDNVDSFIISEGGSIDGSINGGEGGFDSLVIDGNPATVVVPGLIFGRTRFDTVTINGVTVTYMGMEPFVDATNPADVVINGTGIADDLTLAPDPDNPGMMRISGGSSFLFYTNGEFSEGISFANPAIGLSINLRFGGDTLTLDGFTPDFKVPVTINGGFGSDSVNITSDLFLPGQDLTVNAERIHVSDGITVSTRQVGGSQDPNAHLTAASTGASGSIVFNAESSGLLFRALASALSLSDPTGITIGANARLLRACG